MNNVIMHCNKNGLLVSQPGRIKAEIKRYLKDSIMYAFGNKTSGLLVLSLTILIISVIGLVDFLTGPEFSFSIFYTLIIAAYSLYKDSKPSYLIISSVFSSVIWFIAEYVSRHYSNMFFPFWNAFVRFSMFASVGLLIYYLKEKHVKLVHANDRLKALNEEKNELIGVAAHDLRNPIGAVHSFSDIILENHRNKINSDTLEAITYINKLSGQSLTLLDELLDISKIEAGKFNLKIESGDYITFIKNHIYVNEIIAHNKKVSIQLISKIYGYILPFDKNYLGEVIDNLLSNAVKYSHPHSKIYVKISIPDEFRILTEVIDHGTGIRKEEQESLFNYFQTTSTQPTAGEKSTGLGLAIAKKIIIMHNGTIGLRSAFGKGSTFYYTLPLSSKSINS